MSRANGMETLPCCLLAGKGGMGSIVAPKVWGFGPPYMNAEQTLTIVENHMENNAEHEMKSIRLSGYMIPNNIIMCIIVSTFVSIPSFPTKN